MDLMNKCKKYYDILNSISSNLEYEEIKEEYLSKYSSEEAEYLSQIEVSNEKLKKLEIFSKKIPKLEEELMESKGEGLLSPYEEESFKKLFSGIGLLTDLLKIKYELSYELYAQIYDSYLENDFLNDESEEENRYIDKTKYKDKLKEIEYISNEIDSVYKLMLELMDQMKRARS